MFVLLIATLVLTAASCALSLLVWLGLRAAGRRPRRWWGRTARWHFLLVPLYLFVVTPGALGWFATHFIETRGDERKYVGPYLGADGRWQPQTRDDIRTAETDGGRFVEPRRLNGADELKLRAFIVEPAGNQVPRATVIVVHGLFRGALEVDPVGAMFHDLGAEVCIVEQRNHGESDKGPATFGVRESRDLVEIARYLRSRPDARGRPLVLYGVSLGSAAAALAAPDIDGLGGLVLDAPMTTLADTAHRVLSVRARMPQPFRSLTLIAIESWSGCSMDLVKPVKDLGRLPKTLPSLVIGGADDRRMPPEVVRAAFDALQAPEGTKELWIRADAGHGKVWFVDPDGYRERLGALLDRVVP